MRVTLRPYQADALNELRDRIAAGHKRLLCVAPTGAGKTTIAAEMLLQAAAKGVPWLFLAHRTELITQASGRLDLFGVDHGIIKAGTKREKRRALGQVASVQTLTARFVKRGGLVDWQGKPMNAMPPAALIVVDEAHRTLGETYLKILASYPRAVVVGLTATPIRMDGRGLGDVYTDLVEAARIEQLVADGVLMKPRVFAPSPPDLKGVRSTAGDYNQGQLEMLMNQDNLVGNIVEHWRELAGGRRTVVFATSVAHSLHIRQRFREAGVSCEHIDGETHALERARILADLDSGALQVVTNCNVLTEGWDCPALYCVVLARPTKSLAMYLQMVGRGLRTHPTKDGALLLDHAGCVYQHGLPTEARSWDLEATRPKEKRPPSVSTCPACYAAVEGMLVTCPECGFTMGERADTTEGAAVPEEDHERKLVELTGLVRPKLEPRDRWLESYLPESVRELTMMEKQRLYDALAERCLERGYKPGFVAAKFKDLTGKWPNKMVVRASRFAVELDTLKQQASVGW